MSPYNFGIEVSLKVKRNPPLLLNSIIILQVTPTPLLWRTGKRKYPPWDSLVSILLTPNFNEDCPEGPAFVVRGGVNKIRENRFL